VADRADRADRADGADTAVPTSELYRQLDEAEIGSKHWLTVLTAGMGFFTDAYDLFIIGTVTVLLTPIFHLNTNEISLLNSISLLASVAGALAFGKLMDRLGRKRMYGLEVTILVAGAILSAFSWNFTSLLLFRILVGIGVGGDYATSAVITSEYANKKARGRLVGTVFAMQGFGLLAGPAIASLFIGAGLPSSLAWRLMLGLGAVPAASVIYLRRKIRETPRYTLAVRGDVATTAETVRWTLGDIPGSSTNGQAATTNGHGPFATNGQDRAATNGHDPAATNGHGPFATNGQDRAATAAPGARGLETVAAGRTGGAGGDGYRPGLGARLTSKPFLLRLVGTAGSWFLMDIAFYGNSVSSPLILKALQPHGSLLSHTLISLAIFAVAALPGYWVAVGLMDRLGRRRIQWQGFLVMALAFAAIAVVPGAAANVWAFLALFAISYFFIEFGPNETTFVYPSEIFPTSIRGTGDGISAAGGKFGAFLGALFVPHLLEAAGITGVMGVMAAVSAIGVALTLVALPEPRGKTLEEASSEPHHDPVLADAAAVNENPRWSPVR
jgi:PHS family inorganic phosphate transporter-like MFS transporter